MGAYVSLLEYQNIEGMILLSELSRRRSRSVNKLLKVGRKEVVSMIRVDADKNYIDLSKRQVSTEEVITELQSKSRNFCRSMEILLFEFSNNLIRNMLSGFSLSAASKDLKVLFIQQNRIYLISINSHTRSNYEEFVKCWSSIHLAKEFVNIIIIENFDNYISEFSVFSGDAINKIVRLNKTPPNIGYRCKDKGGLNLQTLAPQNELDADTVKAILTEYRIHNADVTLRDPDMTGEDLIDVIEILIEERDIIYRIPHCVPISAHRRWNVDDLLDLLWSYWFSDQEWQLIQPDHLLAFRECSGYYGCFCSGSCRVSVDNAGNRSVDLLLAESRVVASPSADPVDAQLCDDLVHSEVAEFAESKFIDCHLERDAGFVAATGYDVPLVAVVAARTSAVTMEISWKMIIIQELLMVNWLFKRARRSRTLQQASPIHHQGTQTHWCGAPLSGTSPRRSARTTNSLTMLCRSSNVSDRDC